MTPKLVERVLCAHFDGGPIGGSIPTVESVGMIDQFLAVIDECRMRKFVQVHMKEDIPDSFHRLLIDDHREQDDIACYVGSALA